MLSTLRDAWRIPDLRKRMIFTILMILVYRAGTFITVPFIDAKLVAQFVASGSLFGFLDLLSGGNFKNFTIFAMGVIPYINSSIIIQLLTVAIPKLEQMSKEGEDGRKKLAQITRYCTVLLGAIQATGIALTIRAEGAMTKSSPFYIFVVVLTLSAGTSFLMWLGEQITDKGIGNGISLLIFISIVSRYPTMGAQIAGLVKAGTSNWLEVIIFLICTVLIIAAVVTMDMGERRIPVQYAKKVVGRKMYGGQSTHIPINVNSSSVLAIIFAMSFMAVPPTIAGFTPNAKWVKYFNRGGILGPDSWWYALIYFVLVLFFTWFYTSITFNTKDMADNLKKNGGFIPGIRPGKPTVDYVDTILNRIVLLGGLFAGVIALTSFFTDKFTGLKGLQFGGTSILIVVGVALDTVKQIEAQMTMRHYQGFLK